MNRKLRIKTISVIKDFFFFAIYRDSKIDDLFILGFRIYVASQLEIYDDSSARAIPEGGSKWVYKDDQVYFVYLGIKNGYWWGDSITASWSMIVESLDGKVLHAESLKHTSSSTNWSWGSWVPRIDGEKELKVTIIIKSLLKN